MLHMPGHLYYRLGRYDDARRAFLESCAFDDGYMRAEQVHPINNWNYVHNLDYLVATEAESGRYDEALGFAERCATFTPIPHARTRPASDISPSVGIPPLRGCRCALPDGTKPPTR